MKEKSNKRKRYLEIVKNLSFKYKDRFGYIWWNSLVHEKNIYKSNSYKNFYCDEKQEDIKFLFLRSLFDSIKKYCSFIYKMNFYNKKKKVDFLSTEICFDYGLNHLNDYFDFLSHDVKLQRITFQQRINGKYLKSNKITIESFLRYRDFISIFFIHLFYIFKFYLNIIEFIDDCKTHNLQIDDFYRSFIGDILIEGLVYKKCFSRINRRFKNLKKISYVYEGVNWEKILCYVMKDKIKYGYVCSLPGKNILEYYYHKHEADIMPKPDKLFVIGQTQERIFSKIYKNVYKYQYHRYNYLLKKEKIKSKKSGVLIVLGYNKIENSKLINFVARGFQSFPFSPIRIFQHPINKNKNDKFYYETINDKLSDCLKKYKYVIVSSDSSVAIEAIAYNCIVIIPEIEINMSVLKNISCNGLVYFIDSPKEIVKTMNNKFEYFILKSNINKRVIKNILL